MRGPGSSPARVRRRVDGAIDARRTASHDPRIPTKRPSRGVLPPWRFSLPPAAAQKVNCLEGAREAPLEGSLLPRQKRMGDGSPAPTRPAGQGTAPDDTPPVPVPSSVRPSAVHLPPVGEGSLPGEKVLRNIPNSPSIRRSVRAVHLPPRGGRLSCEGLKRHFRQRRRLLPVCPAGRAKKQETAPRRRRKKISLPENKCRRPRL